jgi:A/G-specific adenine glycosylase
MNLRTTLTLPQRRRIRSRLLRWYDENQRSLPWRGERDPYRVWISEVMLQQTRVNAVKDHYRRFLERFPTVQSLARAKPAAVLAAWSGLGYYRRARALHAAARQVARSGAFPRSSDEWRQLPGIGRYTAAAIASIAFGEPRAVVDGNVERVFARMFNLSGEDCWHIAEQLLSRTRPGDFNQALMELGATVCLPRAPMCHACPIAADCNARGQIANVAPQPRNKQDVAFELRQHGKLIRLTKRPARSSLMPNMWELPPSPVHLARAPLIEVRHSITNTDYRVYVYRAGTRRKRAPGAWVQVSRISELPLTGLTRKILRRLDII